MADAREQWLLAGQVLLRRGGHASVKLTPLTRELGLTSGSFYHHFAGMPEFRDALARFYGSAQATAFLGRADDPDPLRRLQNLMRLSHDEDMGPVDAAMRDWAGSDPLAAEAVRRSDRLLLRFLERAFRDLGCGPADARDRSYLLLAAGVARIDPPWRKDERAARRMLELLLPRGS